MFYSSYLQVAYDEEGCYNKKDYFLEDDKYDSYLQVGQRSQKPTTLFIILAQLNYL